MRNDGKKKSVLITGASSGIGKSAARLFADGGWNVAFSFNKSEREAEELEAELSSKTFCRAYRADLSVSGEAEKLAGKAMSDFGDFDALVNNAGMAHFGMIQDMTESDVDFVFAVNVKSAMMLTKAIVPCMISKKSGSIVNVSSVWGVCGSSCESVYSASKAALIGFSRAAAKELAPSGVRVNCVCPGVIDTRMNDCFSEEEKKDIASGIPMGRFGTPEEAASVICFLASDGSSYVTGQTINVNGAFITC